MKHPRSLLRCGLRRLASSLLLCWIVGFSTSPAQNKDGTRAKNTDWNTLIPKIEEVLGAGKNFKNCPDKFRRVDLVQATDFSGVPIALVEWCHMGAYTSDSAILRLEAGEPLVVQLRDQYHKAAEFSLLRGASVRNGADVQLLPEKQAVYVANWHTDDSGALDSCSVGAYVWVPRTNSFDFDGKLSRDLTQSECDKLRNQ